MKVLTSLEIGISAPLLNRSLLRGGNCGAGSVERKIIDGQTYRHDFAVYTVSLISVKTRVAPPVLVSDQRELTRSTLAMTSHLLSSSCWKVSLSLMLARKSYMYRRKAHSADQASATPCQGRPGFEEKTIQMQNHTDKPMKSSGYCLRRDIVQWKSWKFRHLRNQLFLSNGYKELSFNKCVFECTVYYISASVGYWENMMHFGSFLAGKSLFPTNSIVDATYIRSSGSHLRTFCSTRIGGPSSGEWIRLDEGGATC